MNAFFRSLNQTIGMGVGARRVLTCVVPLLLGLVVLGVAWRNYQSGSPGLTYRMGVDLSGGTTLVYEVKLDDKSITPDQVNQRLEEMATQLKRRIDPADLFNIIVRPISGEQPRIEIVMPFGGEKQDEARQARWDKLTSEVKALIPADKASTVDDLPPDDIKRLEMAAQESGAPQEQLQGLIESYTSTGTGLRQSLSQNQIENIKNMITQQGLLQFAILASSEPDREAFEAAKDYFKELASNPAKKAKEDRKLPGQPPDEPKELIKTELGQSIEKARFFQVGNSTGTGGRHTYRWVEMGKGFLYQDNKKYVLDKPNEPVEMDGLLLYRRDIAPQFRRPPFMSLEDQRGGKTMEHYVLVRTPEPGQDVSGKDLQNVYRAPGSRGEPAVGFTLKGTGANKFFDLTSRNVKQRLSIILDGQVKSAPVLNSAISDSGQITGDFSQAELDDLIRLLRAGALPATLDQRPASEATMGATLGQETIYKGTVAIGGAFIAVLLFMVFYYRFSGLVASVALFANLVLTIAFMVLVQATFTLPGLAGLVLTLGMAVDANVLIYERIREERQRGAGLVLALRNGYDRSLPTIIDTHLSSIFTAVVLYVVGNDQLKGFGISLTAGLVISLFTSLYVTRTIFDIYLSRRQHGDLSMMQLFHKPNINFMSIRWAMFAFTVGFTLLGAALFFSRGKSVLDIDFNGGTAYTGRLTEKHDMAWLKSRLGECKLPEMKLEQLFVSDAEDSEGEKSRFFTVRTGETNTQVVGAEVSRLLGSDLQKVDLATIKVEVGPGGLVTGADLVFSASVSPDQASRILREQLRAEPILEAAAKELKLSPDATRIRAQEASRQLRIDVKGKAQAGRYQTMKVVFNDPLEAPLAQAALNATQAAYRDNPQPERLDNFSGSMAKATQGTALAAIAASWIAIVFYLWLRFGNWTFGLAALLCLVHDLFFTLGIIAGCHYLADIPGIAALFQIQDFKIDLPAVAALLTLVGYSVNDTIVVFDRIREVRGRNPLLNERMINDSINQTLSRTIWASFTTWLVVLVLYFSGAEGIHLFAFVMVVGVVIGTVSSIYIASPLLLILGEGRQNAVIDQERSLADEMSAD